MKIQLTKTQRYILLGGFVFLAIVLLVLNNFKKQEKKEGTVPTVSVPKPVVLTVGSFDFQPVATQVSTGSTQEIQIFASSNQKSIVAYDVVLTYDKKSAEILSAESLVPDIDLYPVSKSNYFVITGVKKIDSTNNLVFDNTPLIKLKVVLKNENGLTLKMVDKLGKENTQLVDDKSTILRPEVAEIKLEM